MSSPSKAIVYCAQCRVNGKMYVGVTVQGLARRRAAHENAANRGSGFAFHNAIRKHGKDAFDWAVIGCYRTDREMKLAEPVLIGLLNTIVPNGYNLTGGGQHHRIHSDTRIKISVSKMGHKHSPETILKMRSAARARMASPEYRRRLADTSRAYWASDDARRQAAEATRAQMADPEMRRKLSKALRGKTHSMETRRKMSKSKFGNIHSMETRRKMSISAMGRTKGLGGSRRRQGTRELFA